MPKYTLTYFDARGRAELSRLIFAASGIAFTDRRLKGEEWPAVKPTAPLGQMPFLEIDGVALPQSVSIARYLAREGGIAGKNNLEQAQADAIVDTISDALNAYMQKVFFQPDDKKEEAGKAFLADDVPKHLANIEKLIGLYGRNGFAVGDSLTWADLYIYEFLSMIETRNKTTVTNNFSHLTKTKKVVEEHPKVGPYIKTRPESAF